MKYVILVYSNPESRAMWEQFSDAERAAGIQGHTTLAEDLAVSGELIVAEALADPSTGTRLPATAARPLTTDGPYPEMKEHLAGFYLIDCGSRERALAHAARVPEADLGLVEVRPIMDLSEFE